MNILITGATSGIGRELARQFHAKGHTLALVGRREERLQEIKDELGSRVYTHPLDVTHYEKAEEVYSLLIKKMGGMDLMILNAGIGRIKTLSKWKSDHSVIEVNAVAFAHGCNFAFNYFLNEKKGEGHIVGMSSIASLVAAGKGTAYTATKRFISNYMTGFRMKANKLNADITITDIKPGFIWSEMTRNNKGMFWVIDLAPAVRQMVKGIEKKRRHMYVPKRWRLVAWIAKLTPQWIWDRMSF